MNALSPLLIICSTPEEATGLSELAKALGYSDAQLAIGSISDAIKILDARTKAPSYIIIDIGSRSRDALPELDELALHCEANVNVVVIGLVNDITFYRDLKNRGILEYFPRPVQATDVSAVLQSVAKRDRQRSGKAHGTVISFMSAASGDGSSTVAMNLAYCFAAEHQHSTVLVDMDYQFGLIAKSLDLTAPFGTRELFDHPDRGLDDILVEKMLVKYGEKLNIIASPNELRLMPVIRPEIIQELLEILRSRFAFVIIELPHLWTDWTAAALKHSDHVILVGQLWLRSLTHATRMLTAWQAAGINRTHISLLINRSGAKFKEAITAEEFERICRQKIEAYLNNDIKAVVNAENQGKTLIETAEGSLLQQQIKQIASNLVTRFYGQSLGDSVPAADGKKGAKGALDKKAGG